MIHRSVKWRDRSLATRPPRVVHLAAAGVALIAVCYGLARFAYGLFLPAFRDEFAFAPATAGAIASGSYLAYCVGIVAAGVLSPRHGARAIAVAAGGLATAGTAAIAAAPVTWVLVVGVLVAGASTGVASPPLAQAVVATVRADRRSRVQTVINAGTGVGVAVAGPVALIAQQHWRAAWCTFAVMCALVTVWVARTVPSPPVEPAAGDTGERARQDGPGVARLLPSPLLPDGSGALLSAAAGFGLASAAVWTFGRQVMADAGASQNTAVIGWIVLGAFGVVGAGAADLARRIGPGAAWVLLMLGLAVATMALPLLGPGVAAWSALAVFGACYIGLTGVALLWGTAVYATDPAAGVGLAFLALALGQALGSFALGAVIEAWGSTWAFAVAAGVALAGAARRPPRDVRLTASA